VRGRFIHHIERMYEAHPSGPEAVGVSKDLITGQILGSHKRFVRKEIAAVMKGYWCKFRGSQITRKSEVYIWA
jgi:hypothetical protein